MSSHFCVGLRSISDCFSSERLPSPIRYCQWRSLLIISLVYTVFSFIIPVCFMRYASFFRKHRLQDWLRYETFPPLSPWSSQSLVWYSITSLWLVLFLKWVHSLVPHLWFLPCHIQVHDKLVATPCQKRNRKVLSTDSFLIRLHPMQRRWSWTWTYSQLPYPSSPYVEALQLNMVLDCYVIWCIHGHGDQLCTGHNWSWRDTTFEPCNKVWILGALAKMLFSDDIWSGRILVYEQIH